MLVLIHAIKFLFISLALATNPPESLGFIFRPQIIKTPCTETLGALHPHQLKKSLAFRVTHFAGKSTVKFRVDFVGRLEDFPRDPRPFIELISRTMSNEGELDHSAESMGLRREYILFRSPNGKVYVVRKTLMDQDQFGQLIAEIDSRISPNILETHGDQYAYENAANRNDTFEVRFTQGNWEDLISIHPFRLELTDKGLEKYQATLAMMSPEQIQAMIPPQSGLSFLRASLSTTFGGNLFIQRAGNQVQAIVPSSESNLEIRVGIQPGSSQE